MRPDSPPEPLIHQFIARSPLGRLLDFQVEKIEAEVEAARRLGLPGTFVTQTPLPFPVAAAVRFDGQARFHPRMRMSQ